MRSRKLLRYISITLFLPVFFEYSCMSVQNLSMDQNLPPNKKIKIDTDLDLKSSNIKFKVNKEENEISIKNLYPDVKNLLISFLDPCDVGNILCTCKDFKDFSKSKNFFFKDVITIHFVIIWRSNKADIEYIKYEYIPKTLLDKAKSIHISYDYEIDKRKCNTCEISSFDVNSTFNNEIKIKSLYLGLVESALCILEILDQKKSLRFSGIQKIYINLMPDSDNSNNKDYKPIFSSLFPNLKTLDITGDCGIFCSLSNYFSESITYLDFDWHIYESFVEDAGVYDIYFFTKSEFKNLKRLRLGIYDETDAGEIRKKIKKEFKVSIMGVPESLEEFVVYSNFTFELDKFECPKNLKSLNVCIYLDKYETYSLQFLKRLSALEKLDLKISVNEPLEKVTNTILYPKNLNLKNNWNIEYPEDFVKVFYV